MDSVSGVGVLDKSVAVLAALSEHGPLSLADLVTATGLSRPTAHRLAVALEVHGMVGRDDAGRFRLGLRLLAWGTQANEASGMVEVARLVLDGLRDRTGESAQLYVREDGNRVCVASAERPSGLRDTVPVGAVLAVDRGSGGKVLQAWGDGPMGGASTRAELSAIRARGWAASVADREPGVASVSAPILDGSGRLLAAISVSGPIDRFGPEPGRRFAEAVVAAARDLERRAGLS